jgi:hypothetical protein
MFGIKNYKKLILSLLEAGLRPSTNWVNQKKSKTLLLRHDIDFSMEYALEIGKIDQSLGVKSTFFLMVGSNMYNLLSEKNISISKDLAKMGHKISLHFNPEDHTSKKSFLFEKNVFEFNLGVNIDIVSLHRPRKFLLKNNRKVFGVDHTYMDKYTKSIVYLSDSAGKDPRKEISDYLKNKCQKNLQLLIHPIWWMKKSKSPTDSLNIWLYENKKILEQEVKKNCKSFKN